MLSAFSRTTLLLLVFIITRNISFAQQPSNDNCANAILLTSATACTNTGGTVLSATSSGISANSCSGTPDDDIWFRFIAQGVNTTINISSIGTGNPSLAKADAVVEVFHSSSGDCSTLAFVACGSTPNASSLTVSPPALTIGQTYYIRVFSTSSGAPTNNAGFNICVTHLPPPANDECSGATSLSNGVVNTSGTVFSATASGGIPTGCITGTPDDDVWYMFSSAGAASLSVSLSSVGPELTSSGTRLQLLSGTCGSLISVACGTTSITAPITNGTYYIRVYSAGNTSISSSTGAAFYITAAVIAPPANDECTGAVTLSSGVANTSGTVWLATTSSSIPSGCVTGDPDDDVWYKFTPAGNSVTVSLSAIGAELSSSGTRMQLFSGSCGSLTSVACGTTNITTAVALGSTYYVRVYSAGSGSIGGTSSGSTFTITATSVAPVTSNSGRMKEIFSRSILSGAGVLSNPWEVTYGPDNNLWITESKGYKVYRMNPTTGVKTTVLDISQTSTTAPDNTFRCQFGNGSGAQGGLAGLALHPNFMDNTANEKNWVYISYVYSQQSANYFTNRLVRFTYNEATGRLDEPESICDSLPGSNDHNSQRIIIAPVVAGGPQYLFYASGDMGAGQGSNTSRPIRAQLPQSYEGKILRFNLEEDGDAVQEPTTMNYNRWIPNDNPYNIMLGKQSAVWNIGMRNNQGFAYDAVSNILYGTSHGAYSDDEINILRSFKNYGHPLIMGHYADGNYDGTTTPSTSTSYSAGAPFPTNQGNSTCPPIGSEAGRRTEINANGNGEYADPLFSCYPGATSGSNSVKYIWSNSPTPNNSLWPSEGLSGLDLYTNKVIPGWKQSLVACGLKWGRLIRLKLGTSGATTLPSNLAFNNTADTVLYFQSSNRYRDIAFDPNGKDIYVIMDNNAASVATDGNPPVAPACAGCVVKYSFLGYADNGGKSSIPASIDVTDGIDNTCNGGTTITIDNTNNNLWVPITGPDGNIMAEIKANSNNLGAVTSSFYTNSGTLRQRFGKRYLDRNIAITPATQPSSPVSIRLYLTKAEFDALDSDPASGIASIADLKILKNSDACGAAIASTTQLINPVFAEAHGTNGYVLQGDVNSFSSFYFAGSSIALPMELLTFKGALQNYSTLLQWETINENNTSHFVVERSIGGGNFETIGTVTANGNTTVASQYFYLDNDMASLASEIIYYRLKMVDIDSKFKYSAVVTIYTADITNKITVSPNPAKHETKVAITALLSGKAQWKLTDNNGRVVMQDAIQLNRGNNKFTVNLNRLPGGVYYLNISGAGIDQNIKLQKL